MDTPRDPTEVTLADLTAQLDRSLDDVAAGRVTPIAPVLAAIRARALRRIERREQESQAAQQAATNRP